MQYSAGSGVQRVHVLSGFRSTLFIFVSMCISCGYDIMFVFSMFMLLCVDVMAMPYTYDVSFSGACGAGV